jgi:hypothetical protein
MQLVDTLTMCGDLGETRTPDHGITNSAHLPAEIPGHHIEGSGCANALLLAPKARAADGATQGTRWHIHRARQFLGHLMGARERL